MNPNPFALLNHFTLPFIRDTFLTPGGCRKHDYLWSPQTDFLLLVLPLHFGRDAETRDCLTFSPDVFHVLYPLLWLWDYCALYLRGMSTKTKHLNSNGLQRKVSAE